MYDIIGVFSFLFSLFFPFFPVITNNLCLFLLYVEVSFVKLFNGNLCLCLGTS